MFQRTPQFTLSVHNLHLFAMMDSNVDKKPTEAESERLKKSKKKQKKEDAWRPEGRRDPIALLESLPEDKQQEIQTALHLFSLGTSLPRTMYEAKKHTYRFWETQPVPKFSDKVTTHGPIVEDEASVRKEPYSLPQGFSWDTLDLSSPSILKELCSLLNENYLDEDDNTIRLSFSMEYLQWALQPPDGLVQCHCAVRVDANKKLVGFIAGVPAGVRIYEMEKRMVQVKFLCVHKKLRLKRMTPVLIRELARRANQRGFCQAVYATEVVLPTPLSSCSYWHRPLNLRKLVEVNYPGLRIKSNLQRALKLNRLPEATATPGLRLMTKADVERIHSLVQTNLCKFHLQPVLSVRDVEHLLLPRDNVIDTYVVEGQGGTVTDVVSFYSVSSKLMNHPVHTGLREAHLLYIACTATDQVELMEDMLVLAKSKGHDVFCALDVMDNTTFLEKLKFSISDKSLHYYLYNWMCPTMSPDKVGLVLPN